MATDWTLLSRPHEAVRVELVDLRDCTKVVGTLSGVDYATVKIDEGYYTSTRVQATFTTSTRDGDDGWDDGRQLRVRIVHSFDGYRRDLVTGYVTSRALEVGPVTKAKYTVDSNLYAMSVDLIGWPYSVGAQASSKKAARMLLETCGREYDLSRMRGRRIQSVKVYEAGTSALKVLEDICGDADDIGVDGQGRVTCTRYVEPSARPESATIQQRGPMVLDDAKYTDGRYKTPGSVTAKAGSGDDAKSATYYAPRGQPSSSESRGYNVGKVVNCDEDEPTAEDLRSLARTSWERSQSSGAEWSVTTHWMDVHAGDVVGYVDGGGVAHHCIVSSATLDCSDMTEELTLKEA